MSATKVSSLHVYPIKSTAGISLPFAKVDELGLAFDRRFVLSDLSGQFITARTEPKLCLVHSKLIENGLSLSAANMSELRLCYEKFSNEYENVTVWGDEIDGQLCSTEANAWFSDYLQRPCQLLFFGTKSHRERKKNTNKARKVAFADGYPLLLISQASLDDLNARLKKNQQQTVSMAQFRPNIVVEDCLPFAEDSWQHVRIGDVEFKVSKPCERCIFTTVNPITGEKHAELQPLTTLKSYRQTPDGEVLFGQNLIPLNSGELKLGDELVVLSKKDKPSFNQLAQNSTTLLTAENKTTQDKNKVSQGQPMQLTCQQIIIETHDVKTFVFTWASASQMNQLAGQHINLLVNIFGVDQPCCYTIASAPTTKNELSLTIKKVPNGKVSNFFHDHFKVGDKVRARAPSGNFHLPEKTPKKVLLLSAGSGITPMLSMLRFMVEKQVNNQIIFFHSAHSEDDLIAQNEVNALAKQHGNCQVIYTLTQKVNPQWQEYQGHLSEQMLANIPNLIHYDVYVCGPEGFRKTAQQHLRLLGLPKTQYHYETFGSKKGIETSPTIDNDVSKPNKQKLTLSFEKWHKDYQVKNLSNNPKTILEHGEDAGLILPYSCRAGMCGNCKAKLINGKVKQLSSDGLTADEKQDGYILCCSAIALSDVAIMHN